MDASPLTVYKSPFKKIRLGKDNDGGYVFCDIPASVTKTPFKHLIACGIAGDISFEEDFLRKYRNCSCEAFDGTIDELPPVSVLSSDRIVFVKKNIGAKNTKVTTNLHNFIDRNDKLFLKMDIEGGEIPWLASLNDKHLNKFEQLVIEFHSPIGERNSDIFRKLNKNHVIIHFHGNNAVPCVIHEKTKFIMPSVFEVTWLHKKYFQKPPQLNMDVIPSRIDMANLRDKPDIFINYPPFVNRVAVRNTRRTRQIKKTRRHH